VKDAISALAKNPIQIRIAGARFSLPWSARAAHYLFVGQLLCLTLSVLMSSWHMMVTLIYGPGTLEQWQALAPRLEMILPVELKLFQAYITMANIGVFFRSSREARPVRYLFGTFLVLASLPLLLVFGPTLGRILLLASITFSVLALLTEPLKSLAARDELHHVKDKLEMLSYICSMMGHPLIWLCTDACKCLTETGWLDRRVKDFVHTNCIWTKTWAKLPHPGCLMAIVGFWTITVSGMRQYMSTSTYLCGHARIVFIRYDNKQGLHMDVKLLWFSATLFACSFAVSVIMRMLERRRENSAAWQDGCPKWLLQLVDDEVVLKRWYRLPICNPGAQRLHEEEYEQHVEHFIEGRIESQCRFCEKFRRIQPNKRATSDAQQGEDAIYYIFPEIQEMCQGSGLPTLEHAVKYAESLNAADPFNYTDQEALQDAVRLLKDALAKTPDNTCTQPLRSRARAELKRVDRCQHSMQPDRNRTARCSICQMECRDCESFQKCAGAGACSKCGLKGGHRHSPDCEWDPYTGKCRICDLKHCHEWKEGTGMCKTCGFKCPHEYDTKHEWEEGTGTRRMEQCTVCKYRRLYRPS